MWSSMYWLMQYEIAMAVVPMMYPDNTLQVSQHPNSLSPSWTAGYLTHHMVQPGPVHAHIIAA